MSGSKGGRPKGSRTRLTLTKAYIETLAGQFDEHGDRILAEIREKQPHIWAKLVAELTPKHVQVEHTTSDMTDDQLRQRIAELNASISNAIGDAPRAGGPDPGTPPSSTRH